MIILESVCFGYGSTEVFSNFSLHIRQGEFVAITGPSGSGKTTLLHLISGLERPQAGRLLVRDLDLCSLSNAELNEYRRTTVSVVYQAFNLIPYLTAIENVTLPLYLRGMSPSEQRQAAQMMLERVGLARKQHHLPRELSMGECQRVAIARSLVTRAPILLADEPSGNLDDDNTIGLMRLLDEVNRGERRTVILATHDARAAAYAGRRVDLGGLEQRHLSSDGIARYKEERNEMV